MPTSPRSGRLRQTLAFALLAALGALALAIASSARLEPADFTLNNAAEVSTLDPATITGVPEGRVIRCLYEGLCVKHPRTLEALPGVAESWEVSEDGRTYTFHIRPDARWTDGERVTARDFEYSWRRMLHPMTAAEYAYQLWYVRGAKQYTLLDDELEYLVDGEGRSLFWIQDLGERRVRVGLTGVGQDHPVFSTNEDEFDVVPNVGDWLSPGETLVYWMPGVENSLQEFGHYSFAKDLLIQSINPDVGSLMVELLQDPCGQWLVEGEMHPVDLDELRNSGQLLPGDVYRERFVEPNHLGLRAVDDDTFVVELDSPTPYFLDICAFYPTFPVSRRCIEDAKRRWPNDWEIEWLRPENLVTNGPFRIEFRRVNDRIRLAKNELYWDAANVAFDTVDVLAVDHLGTSLNLYLMGEIDWIDRPITNVIPRLLPREDFDPTPYLGSYFYRVNVSEPPFDDARVRRALALAIDREAICTNITKAGEKVSFGFCPPGMGDYPRVEMAHAVAESFAEGFAADVERARELLAEAGYPGGEGFPTFEIHYNTDQTHKDIAEVIADDWKRHLGLNVKLLNQEWKVYLDAQNSLDYQVSRSAWIGDYSDPNTFLDMFVSGGENNRTGWSNADYDALIAKAAVESDPVKRFEHFAKAEAILLDELPILPIYDYVTRNLVNPRLGGFHGNIQDEHFPKFWYWMSDEELAAKRAAQPADWVQVEARGPAEGKYAPAQRR